MKQQLTKSAIQTSFLKLLSEKQFNKITVRDIVEECGLTRNTFYYYYEDVYDIVDELVCEGIDKAIEMIESGSSILNLVIKAIEVAKENKKSIRNIMKSPHIEELATYFEKATDIIIEHLVEKAAAGSNIAESDKKIIRHTYVYVLRGTFFDWIKADMKSPIEEELQRAYLIFEDSIENAIKRAAVL